MGNILVALKIKASAKLLLFGFWLCVVFSISLMIYSLIINLGYSFFNPKMALWSAIGNVIINAIFIIATLILINKTKAFLIVSR